MKSILKKLIYIFFIFSNLNAVVYEIPYIYKDFRTQAMGGVGVAVGGYAPSVFLNPAGLAKITQEVSYAFTPLRFGIGTNENVTMLVLNGLSATDYISLITNTIGDNINFFTSDYSYVAIKAGAITASVGYVASLNTNIKVHSGFTSSGLVELNAENYYGPIASVSFSPFDIIHIGASMKYIGGYQSNDTYTLSDVTGSSFTSDLTSNINPIGKYSYATLFDFGTIIDLGIIGDVIPIRFLRSFFSDLQPSLGFSLLNYGGFTLDKYTNGTASSTTIPQTMNIGLAFRPDCSWFDETVASIEYHDMLDGYSINSSRGWYGKLRMGLEGYILKTSVTDLILRAGWMNGAYSAGIDYRFFMFHIGASTYVEELGGTIGTDQDRRYILNLDFAF